VSVTRATFIGFSVLGPRQRAMSDFKSPDQVGSDWKGWTCALEGPHVILEGEGRRIEVPRARCVVYLDKPAEAKGEKPEDTMRKAQVAYDKGKKLQ